MRWKLLLLSMMTAAGHSVWAQSNAVDQTARDCRNISQALGQAVRQDVQATQQFVVPTKVADAMGPVSSLEKKTAPLKHSCDGNQVPQVDWQVMALTSEEIKARRAENGSTRWQDRLSLLRRQGKVNCREEQILDAPFWQSEDVQNSSLAAAGGAVASAVQRICGSSAVFPSPSFLPLLLAEREHNRALFAQDLAQLKGTLTDSEKLTIVQEMTEPPKGNAFRSARLLRDLSGPDVKITVTANPLTRMGYVVARGPGDRLEILGYSQMIDQKTTTTTDPDRKPISKADEQAVAEALKRLDGLPGAHGEKVTISPGRAPCTAGTICDWHVAPASNGDQYLVATPDQSPAGPRLDPQALAALRQIEARSSGIHFSGSSSSDYPALNQVGPKSDSTKLSYELGGIYVSAERKGLRAQYNLPVQPDVGQLSFRAETAHEQTGSTRFTQGKGGSFGGLNYSIIFGPNK